ncbi:MAG: TIGR02147 family protein [Bdellovibrionota bacterium]
MTEQLAIQDKIRSHFAQLQRKNPAFSLRAFALKLDISPSALSEIMSGKRKVSKKMAVKLLDRMYLDPKEAEAIKLLFDGNGHDHEADPEKGLLQKYKKNINYLKLSSDQFNMISEWQHFALLSLMETVDFISEIPWMAKRLALSVTDVQKTLNRLMDLNLVSRKYNRYAPTNEPLITSDDVANQAVRKSHYEDLKLAEKVLDHCPVELRDFTAVTVAVDKSKIPEAKKMIREFQDSLSQFLEDGNKDEVYKLTFYMYPLSTSETPGSRAEGTQKEQTNEN